MSLPLAELLYQALAANIGIVVECDDPEILRQRLYAERRKHPGRFDELAFIISPLNGKDLWIGKKGANSGEG